ncbi:MAG: GNAT family N-acetyltransferase [Thermodesulfobacteriota bacterium]
MNSDSPDVFDCRILTAQPADVERAFADLSRDMARDSVHVFLDKLRRYAQKPDRALFLAEHRERIIGFATIIDQSPAPDETDSDSAAQLATYACGTGLMVLPEFRHGHVASSLHEQWERWSRDRGHRGIWVVTRRMAHWYQRCFSYSFHTVTKRHGVIKTVMTKPFARQSAPRPVPPPHIVAEKTATMEKE